MARPEGLGDIAVILAALIFIPNQQSDWRTGGFAVKHTGQNFYRVRLSPLSDVTRRPRLTSIQIKLNIRSTQRHARRTPIDNAADAWAVRFTK
jgi:hypothetical protein